MHMEKYICLYNGENLEEFLKIKSILMENNITYKQKIVRINDGWFKFFTLLFIVGTGSLGMNREHKLKYLLFIKHDDYEMVVRMIR